MNRASIYHRSMDNWCYPLDSATLHVRLQTASDDVATVDLLAGDPFDWSGKTWKNTSTVMKRVGTDGLHDFWEALYRPRWKRTKYYFVVTGINGDRCYYGERGLLSASEGTVPLPDLHRNAFVFPYINEADLFVAPEWVSHTVWYQIFPERFRNGDATTNPQGVLPWTEGPVTNQEFYGGDLKGIHEKLPYFADLGVNGIYLTPIFASPSVHKYDTSEYFAVDPAFGTLDDLRALVSAAHDLGIRILLDAVFNHCGSTFGPWLDVVRRGRDSAYADWFHVTDWKLLALGKGLGYETFAFEPGMPKLNTSHPEVRDFLIKVGTFWLREANIDGWRLDVSNEVDHEFWRAFRKAIKTQWPQAYLVGEIWHDGQRWLRGDQYDAVMNYRYGNAVSDFVLATNRMATARDFAHTLDAIDSSYTLPVLRAAFNVLDSHDTDRFLTRCGGDKRRARLGWLLLFVLRGAPCVYYGSEVGLPGGQDPDNRRCMLWEEDKIDRKQFRFIQALIALRKTESALFTKGERSWFFDDAEPEVVGLRISFGQKVLVVQVRRSPQALPWGPAIGAVVLESQQAWGYRVSWGAAVQGRV